MKFYQLLKTVISFMHSKTAFCNSTNLSGNKNNFKTFQGYPTCLPFVTLRVSHLSRHMYHVTCVTSHVSRASGMSRVKCRVR